jgi:NAD(P)-dependent dehydrogenase (short-subunit alcohol dehydrogenase family)
VSSGFATYPSLKGAVVLVSGGASGIGAEIVRAAHGQGAKVVFLDILESEGNALAVECKGSHFLKCDLTNVAETKFAVESVRTRIGPVRVLVNNAANDDRKSPMEVDEAYWDWSMDVNLKHQFFLSQQVIPHMKELGGGSIINFSSVSWRYGADVIGVYATAKAAVVGLTRMLSRHVGPFNIRVNAIEPGAVVTEKQRRLWYPTQEAVDAMVARQRIRHVLEPDEIARAVLFLASDDSRMITGQTLVVDAGIS